MLQVKRMYFINEVGFTFRGTMNAIGSTADAVTL